MKDQDLLRSLEELVAQLGIQLRYEKGDFDGGLCRVEDQRLLIANAALPTRKKIRVLARELARLELDQVFVMPAVRRVIDAARQEQEPRPISPSEEHANDT
ncbi:MAG: hypothetical protein ONB30_02540 [candidate division KSB1 bacterium]|nr:hypothetical protein [candidate division KSB1 bacterium]MDZ7295853.1 hypothetical protein [candidate division KSB1 bacterium]MDZ7337401.1 hypothetical protein [candidate division KSB1 bacterium]MDZ7379936.1 hypothetical protein [candidate division KSB1 bacterium]MDZ7385240.1 hypothetical protein [candidate division KSB1 bacterium]